MKILLLGASGYLGTNIYSKLKKLNYEVYGTQYQQNKNEFYKIDINNINQVKKIFYCYPDIVIWSIMSKNEENRLTNIGLSNLLKILPSSKKLIYISTDSVFSDGKGNYKEDDLTQYLKEVNPLNIYSNSKIDAEKMVKEHDNHLIIRSGPIYGQNVNGRWDTRLEFLIESLLKKNRIKRTVNLYKTFVHIEDLTRSIFEMMTEDIKGIIHVGPLKKESYYSFSVKKAKSMGLDYSLIDEDYLSEKEANCKGIPLDTSLNTLKIHQLLNIKFRNV